MSSIDPSHVVFLAEATFEIGSGHLVECITLAERCRSFDIDPEIFIFGDQVDQLRRSWGQHTPVRLSAYGAGLDSLVSRLRLERVTAIVTNFRSISQSEIDALKSLSVPVICIDELGGRYLAPDAIINNSIVVEFHNYAEAVCELYVGPQYMSIGQEYRRFIGRRRGFPSGIEKIVISLGGTNPTRSTLRVVGALSGWKPEVPKHVVIGPGFDFVDELETLIAKQDSDFIPHRSLPSLASLMADADVGITVGGNTLYELAFLGTPAVVLYEEPHERCQGDAFAREGFGICLGQGESVPLEVIRNGLESLDSPEVLSAHAVNGQKLVDGLGTDRVIQITRRHITSTFERN